MKIGIHAVGRMKSGPEKELAERYCERFAKAGPAIGLEFAGVVETAEGRARDADERRREEGAKLRTHLAAGAALILLDERGRNISSKDFAGQIGSLRDGGRKSLILAIGGADGHDAGLRGSADMVISFGAATWPHQLIRIMLAEQLYRAATILSGHPYHRS